MYKRFFLFIVFFLSINTYSVKTLRVPAKKISVLTTLALKNQKETLQTPFFEFVRQAKKSVLMSAYVLNDKKTLFELAELQEKRVNVEIIVDQVSLSGQLKNLERFKFLNLCFRVFKDPEGGINHNKFVVVDEKKVWLGSMNFTHYGYEKNLESAVIIEDAKIARHLIEEFKNIKEKIKQHQCLHRQKAQEERKKYEEEYKKYHCS